MDCADFFGGGMLENWALLVWNSIAVTLLSWTLLSDSFNLDTQSFGCVTITFITFSVSLTKDSIFFTAAGIAHFKLFWTLIISFFLGLGSISWRWWLQRSWFCIAHCKILQAQIPKCPIYTPNPRIHEARMVVTALNFFHLEYFSLHTFIRR